MVVFGLIAVLLPGSEAGGQWRVGDRLFFLGVGLTVRNLFTTRIIGWRSVVDVRFAGGDPWVTLELEDTDTLAVMAVQKADGAFGRAEASRLAALVQALGPSAQSPEVQPD